MPYKFGDVVLVRFPFTDQTSFKQRPAVVISNLSYNNSRPDAIIMAITSQLHTRSSFGDVQISQWQAANLLKPSAIKPVIATLEQQLILKHLGVLQSVDQSALRQTIGSLFG
jgi:mRNA interferase MazF